MFGLLGSFREVKVLKATTFLIKIVNGTMFRMS